MNSFERKLRKVFATILSLCMVLSLMPSVAMADVEAAAIVAVRSVKLNKTSMALTQGQTQKLTATTSPTNATNKNVTWKSSAPSIAFVNSNGEVTALKNGTATITVTTVNGAKKATCRVTVKGDTLVTRVTLNQSSITLGLNTTQSLEATVAPSNATNKDVKWTTNKSTVATVSPTGVVTGKAKGTAVITATSGKVKDTCTVIVKEDIPVTGIEVAPSIVVGLNEPYTLTASLTPANTTDPSIVWSSSNTRVAMVSSTGEVMGISIGKATITAKSASGKTARCSVDVKSSVPVTGVVFEQKTITIGLYDTGSVEANVQPENADNKTLTYSSDDSKLVSVNSKTGAIKALKIGTATITAKSADGNKTAVCKVTVKKDIPLKSISLDNPTLALGYSETAKLEAILNPENTTQDTLKWTTSDSSIATVSKAGEVKTAKKAGVVIITATAENNMSVNCIVTVKSKIPVTGVELEETSATLSISMTKKLAAKIVPENATEDGITWTSSNTKIATVSSAGVVKGIDDGKATITVTTKDGKKTAVCYITVDSTVPVTEVKLDKESASIKEGNTVTLKAEVLPKNATNKKVLWSTNNSGIATVTNGVVTGVKAGTASIVARTEDGNMLAMCIVTVTKAIEEVSVTGVRLSSPTLSLETSKSAQLTATIEPANATIATVTWSSSNPAVATVSGGVVSAVTAGTATITVTTTDGSKTATCVVTVTGPATNVPVTGVTLNKTTLSLEMGKTEQLQQTVEPSTATDKTVTWTSSDLTVATVSGGLVTPVKAGTATITVTTTDGSKTATCVVTVTDAVVKIPVTGIVLNNPTLSLEVTKTQQLLETIEPATATDKTVTWTSSDSTVASVTAGLVTALKAGTATITVTTTDGSKTATCVVTVTAAPVTVTSISIASAITKADYTAGNALNLSGLSVTLTKSDTTTEVVTSDQFGSKGITTSPSAGATLGVGNTSVTITHTESGKSTSQAITVTAAPVIPVTLSGVTVTNQNSAQRIHQVGNTLVATPSYSGGTGTVEYKWYAASSTTPNAAADTLLGSSSTQVIGPDAVSKYVYCVVTPTGSTEGASRTSTPTGRIAGSEDVYQEFANYTITLSHIPGIDLTFVVVALDAGAGPVTVNGTTAAVRQGSSNLWRCTLDGNVTMTGIINVTIQ